MTSKFVALKLRYVPIIVGRNYTQIASPLQQDAMHFLLNGRVALSYGICPCDSSCARYCPQTNSWYILGYLNACANDISVFRPKLSSEKYMWKQTVLRQYESGFYANTPTSSISDATIPDDLRDVLPANIGIRIPTMYTTELAAENDVSMVTDVNDTWLTIDDMCKSNRYSINEFGGSGYMRYRNSYRGFNANNDEFSISRCPVPLMYYLENVDRDIFVKLTFDKMTQGEFDPHYTPVNYSSVTFAAGVRSTGAIKELYSLRVMDNNFDHGVSGPNKDAQPYVRFYSGLGSDLDTYLNHVRNYMYGRKACAFNDNVPEHILHNTKTVFESLAPKRMRLVKPKVPKKTTTTRSKLTPTVAGYKRIMKQSYSLVPPRVLIA